MHSINLSVEKLLATAHSGAHIPECGVTHSNNSLRHTYMYMYIHARTLHIHKIAFPVSEHSGKKLKRPSL